ncbi:Alpha-glucan water dikinase 2 [Nymphaea thermarum]|nr:Alpha-glucan water dikinase 2 [Nymphaea thermarum]
MSTVLHKFDIEGGSKLQAGLLSSIYWNCDFVTTVNVLRNVNGYVTRVDFRLSNCSRPLVLHWGGLYRASTNWVLPTDRPPGTKNYRDGALQTPFTKSGDMFLVTIEVRDPKLHAVEFVLKDEAHNKWLVVNKGLVFYMAPELWGVLGRFNGFKHNNKNFQIHISKQDVHPSNASIPPELVEQKAYLLWESKGRPRNSPEQAKQDYNYAMRELQDQLAKGISISELQNSLQAKSNEKADYRKTDGLLNSPSFRRHDVSECLNKYPESHEKATKLSPPTMLNLIEKSIGHLDGGVEVLRHKLNDSNTELTVSLRNSHRFERFDFPLLCGFIFILLGQVFQGTIREENHMLFVVNMKGNLVLHWGIVKPSSGEWLVPPWEIVPEKSRMLDCACQTDFKDIASAAGALQGLASSWAGQRDKGPVGPNGYSPGPLTSGSGRARPGIYQFVDINFGRSNVSAMQFILWTGSSWIKNNGSNFQINLQLLGSKCGKGSGEGDKFVKWLLDEISEKEKEAERSLMHRFNIATELTQRAIKEGELGLIGILVWMRFMATRQLTWNKNYNVKPREISASQDRLTDLLQRIYADRVELREIVRLIMSSVGRGGQGDVGQRIRDEILVLQRKNGCKGGMMEEWHQKLHNNTSPDDVIICQWSTRVSLNLLVQALLDYVKADFKIDVYWRTLNANGITKQRLASYDRPITSEPYFTSSSKDGLVRDLTSYLKTLKAVHSGADLDAAIAACLGKPVHYQEESLQFVQAHVDDRDVGPLLEKILVSRVALRPILLRSQGRSKDFLFLDIALDSTVRTCVERGYDALKNGQPQLIFLLMPQAIMYFFSLVLENVCLSSAKNEDFIYCTKDWYRVCELCKQNGEQWALQTKAVMDRVRLALLDKADYYHTNIQPSTQYLGLLLGVEKWAIDIFTEELIRGGSDACLSVLLNHLDPIISSVEACGFVTVVDELFKFQSTIYKRPTIIIANRVSGDEEIPDGVVAVLTPDMPDILSHISVRARNSQVCFATCFDQSILRDLRAKEGKAITIRPSGGQVVYSESINPSLSLDSSVVCSIPHGFSLKKKKFGGRYAVSLDEFTIETPSLVSRWSLLHFDLISSLQVGAKSRNLRYLKGKLPSWVHVPTSIAIPFGVFETILMLVENKDEAKRISSLSRCLDAGDLSKLREIQKCVLQLKAPAQLINELKNKMKLANISWPGDEGGKRWKESWEAIKKVWASKWNERAYISSRKAKVNHQDICMAVLIQEIVCADYAFVIHTKNPSSGDSSEIYAEVVKGLGESLVGAYPGRAMSFVTKKSNLKAPKVTGYPSKQIGLYIKRKSIIFRSDSNGEDLEGYAGAGLYDRQCCHKQSTSVSMIVGCWCSVPLDREDKVVLDYSTDKLIVDRSYQSSILSKIAEVGKIIESLYGSAQDIEGVVKDGQIYVVQARPQKSISCSLQ